MRITMNKFSGRPNPTWTVSEPFLEKILTAITNNPDSINLDFKHANWLKGFVVEIEDPKLADHLGIPYFFIVGDGNASNVKASEKLADLIVESKQSIDSNNNFQTHSTQYNGNPSVASSTTRDVNGPDYIASTTYKGCGLQYGKFNEVFWNDGSGYQRSNNCYAYACNIRVDQGYQFPHPGFGTTGRIPTSNTELLSGIDIDGIKLIEDGMTCPPGGTIDNPTWIVLLATGYVGGENQEWDYHWYRKVWQGNENYSWGHKTGSGPVTNLDRKLQPITDPEQNAKDLGYTNIIGYCFIPETTIYSPRRR